MPRESGVLLKTTVPTDEIFSGQFQPGDIDLLVLPYEANDLVLERALAIEVKVVRVTFARQGKSPNDFGFSQAESLLRRGFPYVAIIHLIISDVSPVDHLEMTHVARVVNDEGRLGKFRRVLADRMPANLVDRSLGRLLKNRSKRELGLVAAYLGYWSEAVGLSHEKMFYPTGRHASFNRDTNVDALDSIAEYYYRNMGSFLLTPRFDP